MNTESWQDIVSECDTIDEKLMKLIRHMEESACDTFEEVDVKKRPNIPLFMRKLNKKKIKVSKQLKSTRSSIHLVKLNDKLRNIEAEIT